MHDQLQVRPLLAQGLGALGIVPDCGLLEFALYFDQTFTTLIVVKDTPSALQCAREAL
ncbi:hypothetical protein MSNKSG1_01228 [Marinobacter santoriniensis NKSG1]|uniref:Uncharacterized protein n=1 Tax=Marinobacter santoriniensis NKSG1 TaxID=1288826 RepID=M7DHQ8_9GAMM|nr:hypothetical protein MSNKSG1_01228 [Marinobacter santoriniensis NKSG1]